MNQVSLITSCQISNQASIPLRYDLIHPQNQKTVRAAYKGYIIRSVTELDKRSNIVYKLYIINLQSQKTYQHTVTIVPDGEIWCINHVFESSDGLKLEEAVLCYSNQESLYSCRIPRTSLMFTVVVGKQERAELKVALCRLYYPSA
jgi:hypothetical protein